MDIKQQISQLFNAKIKDMEKKGFVNEAAFVRAQLYETHRWSEKECKAFMAGVEFQKSITPADNITAATFF
jgi:hypothetical protein